MAVARLAGHYGIAAPQVEVLRSIDAHKGLGSKTSLAMALAMGFAALSETDFDALLAARVLGRGGASGIGVHLALRGGLVVDAGHGFPIPKATYGPSSVSTVDPPELTFQRGLPEDWYILLRLDPGQGLSGPDEAKFFRHSCPVPARESRQLIRATYEDLVPELRDRPNLECVQNYLDVIQRLGFKALEWERQPRRLLALRERWDGLRSSNSRLSPLGLSSMGTTCFLISDDPKHHQRMLRLAGESPSDWITVGVDNRGVRVAEVSDGEADHRGPSASGAQARPYAPSGG
jgi:beta-ribofuranosylaminobenzene 5'-phosphate synthase